jgi:predicted nucleic acid-binding protein
MVQGLVEDEMREDFTHIERLVTAGRVDLLSGDKIMASEVGTIADRYNLGLGESECIAIGRKFGIAVASDDRKARHAATRELGASNVIGSIGLLRLCVKAKIVTGSEAFEKYEEMKRRGAFLPRITIEDLEKD